MGRPLKDFCVHGHPMEDARWRSDGKGRTCRECERINYRTHARQIAARRREVRQVRRAAWSVGKRASVEGLPPEPVACRIRLAMASYPGQGIRNIHHLAFLFAARYGVKPTTADRAMHSILTCRHRISLRTADEWLTLLGSHLAIAYPELYFDEVGEVA